MLCFVIKATNMWNIGLPSRMPKVGKNSLVSWDCACFGKGGGSKSNVSPDRGREAYQIQTHQQVFSKGGYPSPTFLRYYILCLCLD